MSQRPTPRAFNPVRLDVAAFADARGRLAGTTPLLTMSRLAEAASQELPRTGEVAWSVDGERRSTPGEGGGIWLHLRARAVLALDCQRCLAPVETALEVDRPVRFVDGEAQAAALDAEVEEDVLALTKALNVLDLLEDELLLELPLVPRHAVCPSPLPVATDPPPTELGEPAHPFAALQALRKTGPGSGGAH